MKGQQAKDQSVATFHKVLSVRFREPVSRVRTRRIQLVKRIIENQNNLSLPGNGEGLHEPEKQTSPHRNPATKMESKQEAAASREPVKHLTQWEIQKKIDARKAKVSPSVSVKRSEGSKPKAKETEKDRK